MEGAGLICAQSKSESVRVRMDGNQRSRSLRSLRSQRLRYDRVSAHFIRAMTSISFYFGSIHGGFSTCAGILHATGNGFRCEYKVDIGSLGFKSATREAEIRFDEIESIEFRRGWFKGTAVIRPRSLKALDRFPASGDDALLLYFKRKDRTNAEYLFSELSLRLSQSRLDF